MELRITRRRMPASLALAAAALCFAVGVPSAHAATHSGPTAVVTMGDSYISGEAGRWAGNSLDPSPGNAGTDRACVPAGSPTCQVDKSRVYVDGTAADGCHRSDVAEVISARLPVARRVNIACSGAVTKNLLTAAEGGEGQKGERAQGDQLADVARSHDVKAIVVSIGGNDLGFAGIIARCLQAYVARTGPCKPTEQPRLAAAIPAATDKVRGVIDSIRRVMSGAGYASGDYRLIMQTYPSVAPRAAENRYTENDPRRLSDGCANYDVDSDWARDQASVEIDDMVASAATSRGAELLDLRDLFQGHEVCSKTAREATALDHPSPAESEWGRFTGGSTVQQGDLQEAFHPNAFGQRAFGACLTAAYAATSLGRFSCSGAAGIAPEEVRFRRTATLEATGPGTSPSLRPGSAARLRLAARRVRARQRGGATCVAFTVRSGTGRVRRATVRFAGRHGRTDRRGRVTLCRRLAPGRYRAVATHPGYRRAQRTVRIARTRSAPAFTG
jgi:hypothetical protein